MTNLRLVLEVEVQAGNLSKPKHSMPGLLALLERLPVNGKPQFIRGDCDWGTEPVTSALETKNYRYLFVSTLADHKTVTLDIDATLLASKNQNAQWIYKECTGYMPMVGHIAQMGQVVATDFREGNVAPATNNLAFIHQCEAALPEGVGVSAIRIDAAGCLSGNY